MTVSLTMPLVWRAVLIITFSWIVHIDNSAMVWCRETAYTSVGTSYQKNHPNHVLSTMGLRKGPSETMEPSLATPQTVTEMEQLIAVKGHPAQLPCDVTPPKSGEQVYLVLW